MSDAFCGEIRMFGGDYAPTKWAFCDGQILPIEQNEALYSLLLTMYGGDGNTSYALPDLRGRVPVHIGRGPGMTMEMIQGYPGGAESVKLDVSQIPKHNHLPKGTINPATSTELGDLALATVQPDAAMYVNTANTQQDLIDGTVADTGGDIAHNNIMPSLCVSFIICLNGVYPTRN